MFYLWLFIRIIQPIYAQKNFSHILMLYKEKTAFSSTLYILSLYSFKSLNLPIILDSLFKCLCALWFSIECKQPDKLNSI